MPLGGLLRAEIVGQRGGQAGEIEIGLLAKGVDDVVELVLLRLREVDEQPLLAVDQAMPSAGAFEGIFANLVAGSTGEFEGLCEQLGGKHSEFDGL